MTSDVVKPGGLYRDGPVTARGFTLDEPGECWATRAGKRETHDLRKCEHFLPFPLTCVCDDPQAAHDEGTGTCGICDCNAFQAKGA